MKLTAEKILENRNWILDCIQKYITSPRKKKVLEFYQKYDERLTMMPASHKKEYHSAFEGGYYDHVRRVIECALDLHKLWEKHGVDTSTYTLEELVFSALNHDLGKLGDEENEAYIPQTDTWRRDKLVEDYTFNTKLPFASVPDRGLYLLQSHGIQYSFNEMITIQIHDGLYDEANKKYLMAYTPEQKPRTSLPYIVHQADLMAARIEFEVEYLPKFRNDAPKKDNNFAIKKENGNNNKSKALGSIKSEGLKNMLNNI